MSISETAADFFDACETGKGWEVCKAWCHEDATFSCQAEALADTKTIETYANWMKGLLTPIPDAHYQIKGFATDTERNIVLTSAVIIGTQTGEGGPIPPTGNKIEADYVYSIEFEDGRIRHLKKIWNDGHSLKQLGWA